MCECGWQEPYGFVPEADCPEHDNAVFVAAMNAQFGAASARNRDLEAERQELPLHDRAGSTISAQ